MSQCERFKKQLERVREVTEGMLQAFETPEQWTHQVHPNTNHALWCAGHMANTDNHFVSMLAPDRAKDLGNYQTMFGMNSTPVNDPDKYPPAAEVLDTMRERRQTLLSILDRMSDEDLSKPTPDGAPDMFTDLASVFELAIFHEGMHTGQVSVVRRSLGHNPLFGAPPAEAKA